MAAVTHLIGTPSTAQASAYATGAFTPTAGSLLFGFVWSSGTVATGTMTGSANGITFTKIISAIGNTSANTLYFFIANQLTPGSPVSMTVTFDCTGDAATGAVVFVGEVSGMTKVNSAAVLQSAKVDNAAASVPAPTFAATTQGTNPVLAAIGIVQTTTETPPTGFTEGNFQTYSTPTIGSQYVYDDTGFTGTVVTWGSTTTNHASLAIELDASVNGAPALPIIVQPPRRP